MSLQLPPLSLYVHLPWCARKCPYCDFNSHTAAKALPEQAYLQALLHDWQQWLPWVQQRPLHSVFFGGGTPSLLSPRFYQQLLTALAQQIPWQADIEITLEANPGAVDAKHFDGYRQAGINRLSLGVQSFDAQQLQRLGRIHRVEEVYRALTCARAAGFERINLDVMFALPQQSVAAALADLQQAIDLAPEHLSWYQLTIETNTAFYRQPPEHLPQADQCWALQQQGIALLRQAGYAQYEVSAFAQPAQHSRHNLNYWHFGDYIGLGAGAHGKLTDLAGQRIVRSQQTRKPNDYLARYARPPLAPLRLHPIAPPQRPFEFLLNALRLNQGVSFTAFAQRTGLGWAQLAPAWPTLIAQQLVYPGEQLRCTPRGFDLLNEVLLAFV